jgi:hypothetical protein
MGSMNIYWCGWYEENTLPEMEWSKTAEVRAWITGYAFDPDSETMAGFVRAPSPEAAVATLAQHLDLPVDALRLRWDPRELARPAKDSDRFPGYLEAYLELESSPLPS